MLNKIYAGKKDNGRVNKFKDVVVFSNEKD